jgi:O-methyltransferase
MRKNTLLTGWLYRACQAILTAIPGLVEIKSMTDKALAILKAWNYISQSQIEGDYLEFGVFQGASFIVSMRGAAKYFAKGTPTSPRFFAFDSFQGLPKNDSHLDSKIFAEGDFHSGLDQFKKNIKSAANGWDVRTIPGFYDKTLGPELIQTHDLKKAAFVNIDCDLYSSTMVALRFVTPLLATGTVLYFDDWFFTAGDSTRGESGACTDWLKENPDIRLIDFGNGQIMGKFFLVERKK